MTQKNNWLKLKVDFFQNLALKKLRKIPGGDTYLLIYQKLMLLTVNSEGHFQLQGLEQTLEEELALILDEELETIKIVLQLSTAFKLINRINEDTFFIPQVPDLIGKYDDSSARVAAYRERQKIKCNALQSLHVTECNAPRERIERDIDKEIERDIDIFEKPNFEKLTIEIIDYFNQKTGKNKYQSGSDKAKIKKYIISMLGNKDTIADIKNLIDYKIANPNTVGYKNGKFELSSWINTEWVGHNMSKAKEWLNEGRPTILGYKQPELTMAQKIDNACRNGGYDTF